jgi:phosphoribosylformylglycinamidine (FGAM) synthase PurS component
MTSFLIEIHPKKAEFDPAAGQVRHEFSEAGEGAAATGVHTHRLYRIDGNFSVEDATKIGETLLVDPVIETATVESLDKPGKSKKSAAKKKGLFCDVWPKQGVTDPVGETVEKGLRDLGFHGEVRAASAVRYVFPKVKDADYLKKLAKRFLANELVNDIHIRKIN